MGSDNARAREYDLLLQELKEEHAKERKPMKQDKLASVRWNNDHQPHPETWQ